MIKKPARIVTSFVLPAFLLVSLFLTFNPTETALAADVTVDTFVDERDGSCMDGDCSLRDARIPIGAENMRVDEKRQLE